MVNVELSYGTALFSVSSLSSSRNRGLLLTHAIDSVTQSTFHIADSIRHIGVGKSSFAQLGYSLKLTDLDTDEPEGFTYLVPAPDELTKAPGLPWLAVRAT